MPSTVVTESAWLIADRLGDRAEQSFIASIAAGELSAVEMTEPDYRRCAEPLGTYGGLHLGFVDARVVAVAERLGIGRSPRSTSGTSASFGLQTSTPSC